MNNKNETIISILIDIFITIFAIIVIIQLLLKLFGHSPTEMQVLYGIITIVAGSLIGGSCKLIYKLGRIDQHLISLDKNVAENTKRLERIEERLLHIERKIT